MRSLAIARYRVLTTIRSARWIFAVSLGAALLLIVMGSGVVIPMSLHWWGVDGVMSTAAKTVIYAYFLHMVILLTACELFATRGRRAGAAHASDLTDTIPVAPIERFAGDALGILVCAAAVHASTMPLLAAAIALSPLPSVAFFWLELVTIVMAILASTAASWKYHSTSKWAATQTPRTVMTFLILLLAVLSFTTRWKALRDAVGVFLLQPSPYWWKPVAAAVPNLPLLVAMLSLLYLGFIAYYTAHSVRSLERR